MKKIKLLWNEKPIEKLTKNELLEVIDYLYKECQKYKYNSDWVEVNKLELMKFGLK